MSDLKKTVEILDAPVKTVIIADSEPNVEEIADVGGEEKKGGVKLRRKTPFPSPFLQAKMVEEGGGEARRTNRAVYQVWSCLIRTGKLYK